MSSLFTTVLYAVVAILLVYMLRHVIFTLNRLFGHQRHPYLDVDLADWPSVTVIIPAHNEEAVIGHALEALLDVDYPRHLLTVIPVDDRSDDGTWGIIEDYTQRSGGLIRPIRRQSGTPGKAAVLKDASVGVDSEYLIVFDADYIPGRGLIKQLVAPFFDPEVGAVMGRVVPHNTGTNLQTRLLDMERSAGYQVDQQARMNLGLVPLYGGSVGGVRMSALRRVGGWREDSLAEDTDVTYRLLLHGYKIVYQNRSECYEEVPEVWQERNRQIMRWAKGHNQTAYRYAWQTLTRSHLGLIERCDALLLLGVYLVAPVVILGAAAAVGLYFLGEQLPLFEIAAVVLMVSFYSLGNFAAFFEIAAAVYLDDSRNRIRLLPLNFLNFLMSLININRATLELIFRDSLLGKELHWAKTKRYRSSR